MIIHGRSDDRWKLRDYLRDVLHLPDPVIMGEVFLAGRTLPEKFETLADSVDGAVAIVTPDDVGHLASTPDGGFEQRARQNVWLEAGWFWGRLGRAKFLLLCRKGIAIPSDLQGVEYLEYDTDPRERSNQISLFAKELSADQAFAQSSY